MSAPKSNMPPAARRQVAEANRLIKELNSTPEAAAAAAAEAAAAEAGTRSGEAAAGHPDPNAPPAPPPELPVVDIKPVVRGPEGTPAPSEVTPDTQALTKAEARFKVLQGKYNAEVPNLQQQLRDQQALINKLVLAQNTPTPPAAPPRELSAEERFSPLGVTAKQVEEYGPELLDMIARVAQGTVTPELRQLMTDTQDIKKSLGVQQAANAKLAVQNVYTALNTWNNDWNSINESPEFLAWLDESDVFSGLSRKSALVSAFNSHDAARVVGIFQAYVGKTPVPTPSSDTPVVDRGTLVAPGKPRGGAMEAPDGSSKRILSEQEVGDFYTRVRKRQVSPEEYSRKSAEIALAVAEGRVKPTHHDIHQNGR